MLAARLLGFLAAAILCGAAPAFAQETPPEEVIDRVVVNGVDPCAAAQLAAAKPEDTPKLKLYCKVRNECDGEVKEGYACAFGFWKSTKVGRPRVNDQIIRLAVVSVDPKTFAVNVLNNNGAVIHMDYASFMEFQHPAGCAVRLYQVLGRQENSASRQLQPNEFRLDSPLTGMPKNFRCK